MKTIAAIEGDFERSPLGTASRLHEDLAGQPVLRRTLERVGRCQRVDSIHLIVPAKQRDAAAAISGDLAVQIETHDAPPAVSRTMACAARKWALDGWRGGVGGACWFDEQIQPGLLATLGRREQAGAVAIVPASAVLIDPALLDAMIGHHATISDTTRMTFTPAPPGLAGLIIQTDLLVELAQAGLAPGHLLAYRPGESRGDYLNRPFCYQVPGVVAQTAARLLADSDRAMTTLQGYFTDTPRDRADAATAEDVCRWLEERPPDAGALPREVELELTTENQLDASLLRLCGGAVPRRGPIALDLVRRVVDELLHHDDSLLVLGGFGEPLLHPSFREVLRICRPAAAGETDGVFGLAVQTNGLALSIDMAEILAEHRVDVVRVALDAHSSETYRAVHQYDGFDTVRANLEALIQWRQDLRCIHPLVLPELTKARETFEDMEPFYDEWMSRLGMAVIRGYSHCAGQRPDRSVMNMAPLHRVPCRRLWSRCMVLADGRVVSCDQDFVGRQALGDLNVSSLSAIWTGAPAERLRGAHRAKQLDGLPLCLACDEWHRP